MVKTLLTAVCLLTSATSFAAWQLDNAQSNLSFVSVKSGAVAEAHHFTSLSGTISDAGKAKVTIDLASIESNIPIRNERMKKHLFNTEVFANASIKTNFEPALLKELKSGSSTVVKLPFTLDLHGQKQTFDAQVRIAKLNNEIQVSSMAPVILYASNFELVKGIEKLRDIAKLPSIATSVPVTFNLAFTE